MLHNYLSKHYFTFDNDKSKVEFSIICNPRFRCLALPAVSHAWKATLSKNSGDWLFFTYIIGSRQFEECKSHIRNPARVHTMNLRD